MFRRTKHHVDPAKKSRFLRPKKIRRKISLTFPQKSQKCPKRKSTIERQTNFVLKKSLKKRMKNAFLLEKKYVVTNISKRKKIIIEILCPSLRHIKIYSNIKETKKNS